MDVIINGKKIKLQNSSNVEEMLSEQNVEGRMFVVEKNRQIVQKEDYAKTIVESGDIFEIVGFFGGG